MRRDESTRPYTQAQPIDGASFAHELVPLALATRLVTAGAYGSDVRISPARLTGIAHTMAALVPLYGRAGSAWRRFYVSALASADAPA